MLICFCSTFVRQMHVSSSPARAGASQRVINTQSMYGQHAIRA
jgi:hypothetical protein